MGPLPSLDQVQEVRKNVDLLQKSADLVHGSFDGLKPLGPRTDQIAFFPPFLLHCQRPLDSKKLILLSLFGTI